MRAEPRMKRWWLIFGACAVAIVLALSAVTFTVLELERSQARAHGQTRHEERVRLALWRMDSWLLSPLALEFGRPYREYLPYYRQEQAYTSMLTALGGSDVLAPSPLLGYESQEFPLHFQLDGQGRLGSPQVPSGDQLVLALAHSTTAERVARSEARLARLRGVLTTARLAASVSLSESRVEQLTRAPAPAVDESGEDAADLGDREWTKRFQNTYKGQTVQKFSVPQQEHSDGRGSAQQAGLPREGEPQTVGDGGFFDDVVDDVEQEDERLSSVTVGTFVPLWVGDAEQTLVFARRVDRGLETLYQGFSVNWESLHGALLNEAADLFDQETFLRAELLPLRRPDADTGKGLVLATIPAWLHVPPGSVPMPSGFTAERGALTLAWLAALCALVAVATTLRSSFALSERRSRFASAVTHELRTPLTTFRMYSEMLADDMVRGEEQRREYLQTLKSESNRLARLVENVLFYARLEEGRSQVRLESTEVGALLDRIRPVLERRAAEAGMRLSVQDGEARGRRLLTDGAVVEQILFNLVDNAAKYARGGASDEIVLAARPDGDRVVLSVWDSGPGIPAGAARRVFEPFERDAPEPTPGVGLGLALARGLARELGGDLVLDGGHSPGARFVLTLKDAG